MKTLSYGDEIENAEVGTSNLELLISDDKLSANSVNRILQNLYEDNEYNYTLIQNLIKNLYGREDGILPNILEEFKKVRILESGTGQSYFRVPFGAINVMQPHYKDIGMSHGLSYSGVEGDQEKKIVNTDFIDDGFDTYTFFNKPKLSIAKRQIANYINLDIADLDNNIKIFAKKFDNAEQLGSSYVHRIAKSNSAKAEIETFGINGGKDTEGNFDENNTLSKLDFPFVGYYASITENTVGAVDSSIYTANTENVNFPNLKKDTTWVIAFTEKAFTSSSSNAENTPLTLSFYEEKNGNLKDASLYLPAIDTFVNAKNGTTIEEQINTIVSDINASYKDYYYAEKINVEIAISENAVSYPAISITSRINYTDLTDNVKLFIRLNNSANDVVFSDSGINEYYYSGTRNDNTAVGVLYLTKTSKAETQDYYYDSISLLTGIFSKYSSYVVNENFSKGEFALEETINIPKPSENIQPYYREYLNSVGDVEKEYENDYSKFKYFIYLNSDLDEKYDIFDKSSGRINKNVSTSKMFGCEYTNDLTKKFEDLDVYKYIIKKDLRSKPIALFSVIVRFEEIYGKLFPVIEEQHTLKPILDPNKINTRFAELNKLSVNTNTEIKNQFYYTDEGVKNYSVTLTSNIKDKNNELIPIEWKANPEEHGDQLNNTELEGVFGKGSSLRETRAIKACVSSNRDKFSSIADDGGDSDDAYYKNVIKLGIDDVIETFAPYVLSHSRDGRTQEVLASGYGKRIKLHKDRKLRVEQQQTHGNFNDLNLLEITKDGFLFKRNDNSTSLVKNYINLTNDSDAATSEMKARDVGILLSAKEYTGNADNDENNYFKLYANNNKTWIKGVTGKLTIAANHSENEESDIVLENKLIKYFDFSAKYGTPDSNGIVGEGTSTDNRGNVSIESTNVSVGKGAKYLRLKGNFVIGNEANDDGEENSFINKTPYVAIFNTDTFLKGKLNVTALNNTVVAKDCSSFTVEKDKIFASNYNDIWVNGNYKAEKGKTQGRYSLRIKNDDGLEFAKVKAGSDTNADINKASTLKINDDKFEFTFKDVKIEGNNNNQRHTFTLCKDHAQLLMSQKEGNVFATDLIIDNFSGTDDNGNVKTYIRNKAILKVSEKGKLSIRSVKDTNTSSTYENTKLFANVDEAVLDINNVYVGGKNRYDADNDKEFKVNNTNREGNLLVRNKTVLGLDSEEEMLEQGNPSRRLDLQVWGRVLLGHELLRLKENEVQNPEYQYYDRDGWPLDKQNNRIDDFKLFVAGSTVFGSNLNVEGDALIGGDLSVKENVTMYGDLEVTENSILEQDLNVKGNAIFNTNISKNTYVQGGVKLAGDLVITKDLKVGADQDDKAKVGDQMQSGVWYDPITNSNITSVPKNLTIKGDAIFNTNTNKTTQVVGDVDIESKLTVTNNVTIGQTNDVKNLTIKGNAVFNTDTSKTTQVTDKVTIEGQLQVSGTVDVSKNLVIGPSATTQTNAKNTTIISGGHAVFTDGNDVYTDINGGGIICTYVQTSSSRTKKKHIVHSERDAVKAINDIEIVDFFYKNDKDERNQKVGFIAEDTDSIFSTNKKDCMDHSNCIGMLLKAIQELSAEIEELKKNA